MPYIRQNIRLRQSANYIRQNIRLRQKSLFGAPLLKIGETEKKSETIFSTGNGSFQKHWEVGNLIYPNRLGKVKLFFKGFLFIFQLLNGFLGVPVAFQTISSRKIIFRLFRFSSIFFYDLLLLGPLPPQKNPDSPRIPHFRKLLEIKKKSDFRFWATKSDSDS